MNALINTLATELTRRFPDRTQFKRAEIESVGKEIGIGHTKRQELYATAPKVRKGVYELSALVYNIEDVKKEPTKGPSMTSIQSATFEDCYVPTADSTYVKWGTYNDVESIIKSRMFYPVFITGLSGNGKTMMVEQACAKAGREFVRVQVTPETDEDDLIGGFRLVDGETVFFKGPVVHAMEKGAILLIDEIDRGTNKIMALQGVLEGKPVLLKKTGEVIKAAPGFNVIATANTKGKGSDDGRFTAASIIDDAFLERFVITVEQPFAPAKTEKRILKNHMEKYGKVDEEFADRLVLWAEVIRKTFEEEGVDEVISTRRLCHITQTFSIFEDRMKAIELCIARFDEDTKLAFLDLYTKVDRDAVPEDNTNVESTTEEDLPF